MYLTDYEMRLLAEQRSAELIALADRLNQLHDAPHRPRRKYFRSLLVRFRRPVPGRTVVGLQR